MRCVRWLTVVALLAGCWPLLGCSTPTTQLPAKQSPAQQDSVKKPNPDPG